MIRRTTARSSFHPHSSIDTYCSACSPYHQQAAMREDSVIEDGSSFQESKDALSFTDYKYFYLFTIIPLCIANCSDATEILCLSYILSDSTFQSTVLLGSSGGTLAGAIFAGMLLGGILLVILGEAPIDICNTKSILVGRRRPWILVGLAINSIAGFASAFASNMLSMTIIRSIAGIGIGISVPPLFTLVAELSPPQIRGVSVSLVASFWMIGSLFVSLVALLIFTHGSSDRTLPAWRVFAMICAIPSFVAFILVFIFIPESPRYLSLHHKWDEAQKAHATLVSRSPTLIFDSALDIHGHPSDEDGVNPLSISSSPMASNRLDEAQETRPFYERKSRCSYLSNLTSLRILYLDSSLASGTTLPLNILWFSLCFGSYGLFTWINSIFSILHLRNIYFQSLLFALANLPGNIASACLVDRIGRKKLLVSSMLLSALFLILLSLFALPMGMGNSEPSYIQTMGIVLSACSFQACIICGWNMIDCITSESFPTNVRNSGMAVCTAWGRVGAMLAQFVNGFLISSQQSPIPLLLIASLSLLIGSCVPFWIKGEDMTFKPLSDFTTKFESSENSENRNVPRKLSEECDTLLPEIS